MCTPSELLRISPGHCALLRSACWQAGTHTPHFVRLHAEGHRLESEGRHPVCILTRDEAIPGLRNVVVAIITGRIRGLGSEVALGPDDGMPQECAISLDNLRTVPKALLAEPITMLGAGKLNELCGALNAAVDC